MHNFKGRTIQFLVAGMLAMAPGAALANLVINEVEYDQPGTDASEFLELKNTGPGSVLLSDYQVEFGNGSSGGALYLTVALPGVTLDAGEYFVICANAGTTANCDLDTTPDTNLIQNGAPDGIRVRHIGSDTVVDALSYEGATAGYTEGTGAGADDGVKTNTGLSRHYPDGRDTNDNSADFRVRLITPGQTNAASAPAAGPLAMGISGLALLFGGGWALSRKSRRAS